MKIPPEFENLSKRDFIRLIYSEREEFAKKIEELERRLLAFENAHTPPSQKRNYPKREKKEGAKLGAPKGHKGITRKTPEPTETKKLHLDVCPECQNALKLKCIKEKIIEEIPDPQPLRVIRFKIPHYHCSHCNKEIIATDPELPDEGKLGNNLLTEIAVMRFEDRLPQRKIVNVLNRKYHLSLTAATILDVLRRVADKLSPKYEVLKQEVKNSRLVNADETGAKLDGKKHYFWLFMSLTSVLFMLRPTRSHKVIVEALGKNFEGFVTCDGYKAYSMVIEKIQRCWAHLLRDAKFLAQKHEGQARVLYDSLYELFVKIKSVTVETPVKTREKIYEDCIKMMQLFVGIANKYKELKKLATTIGNGMKDWFTCILHPEIEPTNNRAERELREFVVQRKIFGSFRSEKGLRIAEVILSLLSTWRLRGLNTFEMLRLNLSS